MFSHLGDTEARRKYQPSNVILSATKDLLAVAVALTESFSPSRSLFGSKGSECQDPIVV